MTLLCLHRLHEIKWNIVDKNINCCYKETCNKDTVERDVDHQLLFFGFIPHCFEFMNQLRTLDQAILVYCTSNENINIIFFTFQNLNIAQVDKFLIDAQNVLNY